MDRKKIFFVGIGGTGMSNTALLAKKMGHQVLGSDQQLYPPTSIYLAEEEIEVRTPYDPANVAQEEDVDLAVITNAVSKGHPEVELLEKKGVPLTSFPAFLEDNLFPNRQIICVAGTHGKTTTTSIITHLFLESGLQPGYLIGGHNPSFPENAGLGREGGLFVVEGDEYDTAYFDKHPKFLHYRPSITIVNHLEYDHVDIYPSFDSLKKEFHKLVQITREALIFNADVPEVNALCASAPASIRKIGFGFSEGANIQCVQMEDSLQDGLKLEVSYQGLEKAQSLPSVLEAKHLHGQHNAKNILAAWSTAVQLFESNQIQASQLGAIQDAFRSFGGVRRRLEKINKNNDLNIFEDFAHHPTAIEATLLSLRQLFPEGRILAYFEPVNATGRRNVFLEAFAKALDAADQVILGPTVVDTRIPEEERMQNALLAQKCTVPAVQFEDRSEAYQYFVSHLKKGDCLVFMSSGDFGGLHRQIVQKLDASDVRTSEVAPGL